MMTPRALDAIARAVGRACGADRTIIFVRDGERLRVVGRHPARRAPSLTVFIPLERTSAGGRAVLDRRRVRLAPRKPARNGSATAVASAAVPLMSGAIVLGALVAERRGRAFSAAEVERLARSAHEAALILENTRLAADLAESRERQTATAEILHVITVSQTDAQPVFDAIARAVVRLCDAVFGAVFLSDGQLVHIVARHNFSPKAEAIFDQVYPAPLAGRTHPAWVIRESAILHIPDVYADDRTSAAGRELAHGLGFRSLLMVPMRREAQTFGCLAVAHRDPGPYSDGQIALFETFADQAVIAIENARLFREIAEKSGELEVASRHKSEFLANMSHELRTPLNAILGFSEVLVEGMFGEMNAKQEEYVKDIMESGRHLLSLINDILDLSKIEAGRMELELTEFDLPEAIGNAVTLVRERAARRAIALHLLVDERLGLISGDERKVKQVTLNLLSNALKFTPEGGRIDVRAARVEDMAEISVADTGIGIAPEDQEAVFEEFRQVGSAEKKAEGTGLGLALSRKFIELHSGRIWLKSQAGVGSTFTFTLPLARPRD